MSRAKTTKKSQDKFQMAVDYLIEYAGVRGVAIADPEGLVIAHGGNDFDAELHCALAQQITASLNAILPKLIAPEVEHLIIKTPQDWLTVARSATFLLIVVAERNADELLNIRIGRALEMISSHLKGKYQPAFSTDPSGVKAKKMEAINV
jgi:predicted regulator of Ras-like GTPase activity (Roadblock/LC7/MglB family)